MAQVVLHIEGMSCGHCLQAVRRTLSALDGVEVGQVTMGRAEVELTDGGPSMAAVAAAVSEAGYPTTPTASV